MFSLSLGKSHARYNRHAGRDMTAPQYDRSFDAGALFQNTCFWAFMLILEAGPIIIYTLVLPHLGTTTTVLLVLIF